MRYRSEDEMDRRYESGRDPLTGGPWARAELRRLEVRAVRDARADLEKGHCPVHGDLFSDDGTCQSCYQDRLAAEVCSG